MFTKHKSQARDKPIAETLEDKIAPPVPPAPAAPSIISSDAMVTGDVVTAGELQINGKHRGNIRAFQLIVGEKAHIEGDIVGDSITVRGRINGNIRGVEVKLVNGCDVRGNILHDQLSVESGALFEGRIRRSENPLSEEAAKAERQATASPVKKPAPVPPQNGQDAAQKTKPAVGEQKVAHKKAPAAQSEKNPVIVEDSAVIVRNT